jgi:hypothetical protein
VRIAHEAPAERATTATLGSGPAFDASSTTMYRLEQDWLIDHGAGTRVGQVLGGLTWFRTGEHLGFGFYRASQLTVHFLFRRGEPGLRQVDLPQLVGRVLDAEVVFDDRHLLYSVMTEHAGRLASAVYLIDERGQVVARRSGAPEDARFLAHTGGKALSGKQAVCATDEGLVTLTVDARTGLLTEGALYEDTRPFVQAGCDLFPGPDGSIYVVTTQEITQLTLG